MNARDEFAPASSDGTCTEAVWGPMCDEIDRLRAERDRIQSVIDAGWELRHEIASPFLFGWMTGLLEVLEGVPPYSEPTP